MPEALSERDIQNTLYQAVQSAVDYVDGDIAKERLKAQRYFNGECDVEHEDGRSEIVATVCRDTVRAVMPALMRIFLQSGKPCEFMASTAQSTLAVDQQTEYARHVFEKNNGFSVLYNAFMDALRSKTGIVKAYADETPETEIDEYSGLPAEAIPILTNDENTEVLEIEEQEDGLSLRVARTTYTNRTVYENIAPEDFFVDSNARSRDDFYVMGHRNPEARVGDLVEMGFDFDDVIEHAGTTEDATADEEEFERNAGNDYGESEGYNDESMRKVLLTEAYMRMDMEGTGVPQLYKFICVGSKYEIFDQERCDYLPYCVFEVDPEPHTFFGRSLVDLVIDDQDAMTSLRRNLLDSMYMALNPTLEVVEGQANLKDVMDRRIGAIWRTKIPNAVREVPVGLSSTAVLPAIDFYEQTIRQKTGIVGAGMGLDVDALQSQTAQGVRLAEQTTAAMAELMARTLAETGMTDLMRLTVQLAAANPNPEEMIQVNGQYTPIDPRSWNVDAQIRVNVGIGTNRHEEKLMALEQTSMFQNAVGQMFGPVNDLVGFEQIRNLQADKLKLAGIHAAERYIKPVTAQNDAAFMERMAQQQPQQGPDIAGATVAAEQIKSQDRRQKNILDARQKAAEAALKDDLERDKMAQDLTLKAADLYGKHRVAVDQNAIKREQAAPRMPTGIPPQ